MKKSESIKLAASYGLEDYVNYKIENGSIYTIQTDEFGREFWLFFGKKTAYRNNEEMYADIAASLKN
jgi:hypothetical protein